MARYNVRIPVDLVVEITATEEYRAEEHALKFAEELVDKRTLVDRVRYNDRYGTATIHSRTLELSPSVGRDDLDTVDIFERHGV